MTYIPASWTCDVCGQRVSSPEMVTLTTTAGADVEDYRAGYLGHFHDDCWTDVVHRAVDDVIDMHREVASVLARIPVAREFEIEVARRAHRLPNGQRPYEPDPDLARLLAGLPPGVRSALPRAGVRTLEQLARMTDQELLAIERVGAKTVAYVRERLADPTEGGAS
jgi:hypothetical protein